MSNYELVWQREDGRWVYADETWQESYESFDTKEEAEEGLRQYAHWLDTGELP